MPEHHLEDEVRVGGVAQVWKSLPLIQMMLGKFL